MNVDAIAVVAGGAVVVLALVSCVLRRSLIALAFGQGLGALGLALAAGALGRLDQAALIVAAGVVASVTLTAAAVAVYRRRGADFADELRELGGG
jgi:Ca2+/H+ antiporter